MLKTHQFLNVFAFLKKYDEKKCPRRVIFAAHYESRLFSSFALLTVPWAPSWPPVHGRHKTYGFFHTGWPSPFQNPRKMHTFALGFLGGLCRIEPSGSHLGPSLRHLGHIWVTSWSISNTSSALWGHFLFSFLAFFFFLSFSSILGFRVLAWLRVPSGGYCTSRTPLCTCSVHCSATVLL